MGLDGKQVRIRAAGGQAMIAPKAYRVSELSEVEVPRETEAPEQPEPAALPEPSAAISPREKISVPSVNRIYNPPGNVGRLPA